MQQWTLEHGMSVRRVGRGPTVVWIHGLGESSAGFDPVLPELGGYTHVLVDLPGYGRSPWPDDVIGLDEVASRLARWLANEQPAVLVGHSMGGVLATFVAELAPVRGVVNIDGNLTRGDCTFSAQAGAYSLADFRARGFETLRAEVYGVGAQRPELRGYHAAMYFASPDVFHRHALDLVLLSAGDTLAPRLAALTVPKLFVAGVPRGVCAASRARLDELRIPWLSIEPAGHWVHLDQHERFATAVDTFLMGA
jgi:pimeloyl-ACP methyl ester carboxylesterase